MARYYQTLAPARYQVREGVRGGWYILDTDPGPFPLRDGTTATLATHQACIYKNTRRDYWRTYDGAKNAAQRLNAKG